jgi:hypothetical protein
MKALPLQLLVRENKMSKKSPISLKVVNFDREMKRIEKEIKSIANDEIEKRVDYAVDTLVRVTPVDTGEARKGWEHRMVPELDGTDGAVIKNDVDHIVQLNQGHSKQAPKFFIEQVLSRLGLLTP